MNVLIPQDGDYVSIFQKAIKNYFWAFIINILSDWLIRYQPVGFICRIIHRQERDTGSCLPHFSPISFLTMLTS
jgi:hypothetical protein